MTRDLQITFDCADPAALAAFWAEALGYHLQSPPDGFGSWDAALEAFGVPREQWNSRSAILPIDGPHPRIFFQRVPEGKTGKNRLHPLVTLQPRSHPHIQIDAFLQHLASQSEHSAHSAERDS